MKSLLTELERRYAEIRDLQHALAILGWDQEVTMPPGGAASRAHTLATLSGLVHERTTDPALVRLVRRLAQRRDALTPQQRRAVDIAQRDVRKATAIPGDLARRLALAESQGVESWRRARARKTFRAFVPDLQRLVDLKREVALLSAGRGNLYDALLDDYEPGATTAVIDPLLDELKRITVPLVRRVVASKVRIDVSPFVGRFDVEAQREFGRQVAASMGIDLSRGRMDLSTHPFCGGVGPDDVRMTSRYDSRDMRGGLFGVIHEAGHGLYEQGLDGRRARHPLGGPVSMAIHESQSRLWENNVARSRPFWKHWLPRLRRAHPSCKGFSLEQVVRAANELRPSLIRVEADELTYNLHIVLRYEIERDLVAGRLAVRDLPERWNEGMRELLGVVPRHAAEGVLQDIHWGSGLFGYFPTYSLGNLYAAQFMEAARRAIPDLDGRVARGDLATLRTWLRTSIHQHDQVYDAARLCQRITGRPLSVDAFRRHITEKVEMLYG